jgi:hypothetical protein
LLATSATSALAISGGATQVSAKEAAGCSSSATPAIYVEDSNFEAAKSKTIAPARKYG